MPTRNSYCCWAQSVGVTDLRTEFGDY